MSVSSCGKHSMRHKCSCLGSEEGSSLWPKWMMHSWNGIRDCPPGSRHKPKAVQTHRKLQIDRKLFPLSCARVRVHTGMCVCEDEHTHTNLELTQCLTQISYIRRVQVKYRTHENMRPQTLTKLEGTLTGSCANRSKYRSLLHSNGSYKFFKHFNWAKLLRKWIKILTIVQLAVFRFSVLWQV